MAAHLAAGETNLIDARIDNSPEKRFCTRAVTGCCPVFQEIYICRTCCSDNQQRNNNDVLPLCVCSACADECHLDHDIEYVGMGPCFCDCNNFNCKILLESVDKANRLGITATNHIGQLQSPLMTHFPNNIYSCHAYVRDVYHIPSLQKTTFRDGLVVQSKELIRHSKDTFWLDAKIVDESMQCDKLCQLEYFAWSIFCQHVKHYFSIEKTELRDDKRIMGAEWWVQVKTILPLSAITSSQSASMEAIDLHYDKDEEMVSSFGIGIFPSISTVTYLTDSPNASPTIIFPRRYDENDDDENEEKISDMLISYPNVSKHVAFDGRLLHGAPSHSFLRRQLVHSNENEKTNEVIFPLSNKSNESATRITFLVNIWIDHKPVCVRKLADPIRAAIKASMINEDKSVCAQDAEIVFIADDPPREINLTDVNALPEFLRQRIELPFVGGNAVWGGKDDECDVQEEAEGAMVLTAYAPLSSPDWDTILVLFGSGLEAKFKYDEAVDEQ